MADGWMQLCPSIRSNGLNHFLIEQINFHTLLHDMYLWNIYTTQKIHRKKYKEIYLVKTQVPKKWRHLSNNEPKLARVKRILLYLLLVTMVFQFRFTKSRSTRKTTFFCFWVPSHNNSWSSKKREDWCLYSLNLIARICRLDNFKSLHNMKILFGCISYFQQIFFGTVWKSINKTFVFPATLFQNWMASTAVRENICQLFFSRLDATTTLMKNEIWMTRWFFDLFFLLCLYETLIFLRKVSFHDEKNMLPLHIYFSSISAKCNIHDTF